MGGLGIPSAEQLAPSAFLASAAASGPLVGCILPGYSQSPNIMFVDEALSVWSGDAEWSPPSDSLAVHETAWLALPHTHTCDSLLEKAETVSDLSRLQAVSARESGAWLKALPITSLGLRMDDVTVRVALALRLGADICLPHLVCNHCQADVGSNGTHGLSCRKSQGRHSRHSTLNDIIHRALNTAHIPSRLEPADIQRSDGKRPDGITLVPWGRGRQTITVGCDISRYLSTFIFTPCSSGAREGC